MHRLRRYVLVLGLVGCLLTAALSLGSSEVRAQTGPPSIASFTADQGEITVPGSTYVRATADQSVYNTGYEIHIIDEDTGDSVATCGSADTCARQIWAGWSDNKEARPRRMHAEIRRMSDGGAVSTSGQVTVDVRRHDFQLQAAADASSITTPDSTHVRAGVDQSLYNTGYEIHIVPEDGQGSEAVCGNSDSCARSVWAGWSDNGNTGPRRFHAEVRHASNGHVAASSEQVTVTTHPHDFDLQFSADDASIRVPGSTHVRARTDVNLYNTGYEIRIIDLDDENSTNVCGNSDSCSKSVYAPWSVNANPTSRTFKAEVKHISNGHVAETSEPVAVARRRFLFDVSLDFSTEEEPGGATAHRAKATTNQDLYGTLYELKIRTVGGSEVCSTPQGTQCGPRTVSVGGVYRATVEDSQGRIFGASPHYTLTPDGPREERIDDLDLALLASMFGSAEDICTKLLPYPGPHLMEPPSSLSDEYRACETARGAGKTGIDLLRAIVAGGTAYGALHFLRHEAERVSPAPGTGTSEDSEAPRPVPGPVLSDVQDLAGNLMDRQPQLTQAQADTIARQCMWLGDRLGLNSYRKCRNTPIFSAGADVAEATDHDLDSLAKVPAWFSLNYRPSADNPAGRTWYTNDPACAGGAAGQSCHEYPWFATEQGGGNAVPRPRLRLIDGAQNSSHGTRYGAFTVACLGSESGRQFLGAPTPPDLGIPTYRIC